MGVAGLADYMFVDAIVSNTVVFAVTGFSANVADFVSLSGDLGFKKEGDTVIAVGANIDASLDAGSASLSLEDASFGLQIDDNGTVFELKDGAFTVDIPGLTTIAAESTLIRYAAATASMTAGTKLSVGAVDYTFDEVILPDTVAFALTGFTASVSDFVSLSGDVGFKKEGGTIIAVGANLMRRWLQAQHH